MKRTLFFVFVMASLLTACAAPTPVAEGPTDLDHARQTLIDFFSLLSNGEYAEAVGRQAYDAEFYESARQNNPAVDPEDSVALMEATCTYQFRCLEILQVVSGEQLSDREFMFVVEFANPGGTLFVLGPCCGADETEMPPVSQFQYTVEKVGSEFLVHGGPVYVP